MPPADVLRQLRREVGFGCPVNGCCSPYLTWHHFDPPWDEKEHHNPKGMIALCREHHDKADAGNFTREQLRKLKTTRRCRAVGARFDWRRQALLAVIGGSFYYEPRVVLRYRGANSLFFTRDEERNFLLNLEMPSSVGQPRLQIRENFWIFEGQPLDLRCPPSGKALEVKYGNGDRLAIRFADLRTAEDAVTRCRTAPSLWRDVTFPLTAVNVTMNIPGTSIDFGPRVTRVGGIRLQGGCFRDCEVALDITD